MTAVPLAHVVLDTNVTVSSLISPHAPPGQVVDAALNGVLVPVISSGTMTEYCEVWFRPHFKKRYQMKSAANLLRDLFDAAAIFHPARLPSGIHVPDPDDAVFYATALASRAAGNATYLVTGNLRHFPQEEFIVSPRAMLDIIGQGATA